MLFFAMFAMIVRHYIANRMYGVIVACGEDILAGLQIALICDVDEEKAMNSSTSQNGQFIAYANTI